MYHTHADSTAGALVFKYLTQVYFIHRSKIRFNLTLLTSEEARRIVLASGMVVQGLAGKG